MVLLVGFSLLIWGHPVVDFLLVGERPLGEAFVYLGLVMSVTSAADYARHAYAAVAAKEAAE